MKQILIIGDMDKSDMMFYLCKLISLDHRVLLADVTRSHRYEHAYPKIEMEAVIRQHDQFDIAENVRDYTQLESIVSEDNYDFVLVDIDSEEAIRNWPEADMYFLATTYENGQLQTNLKLLEACFQAGTASKLYPISRIICEVADTLSEDYLDELYDKVPIQWKTSFVYYPEERDLTRRINNQWSSKVILKKLSGEYKKVLTGVTESILDMGTAGVAKLWKRAERR